MLDLRPVIQVRPAYLHLPIKFLPLHFPHFDNTHRQACSPGNLTILDMTLAEVEKKVAEKRIFDEVDRLHGPVGKVVRK